MLQRSLCCKCPSISFTEPKLSYKHHGTQRYYSITGSPRLYHNDAIMVVHPLYWRQTRGISYQTPPMIGRQSDVRMSVEHGIMIYIARLRSNNILCVLWYRQLSNISRTQSPNINVSRLVLQLSLPNPLKPGCWVENEDVVGAAPTGDAPTTSEWSTIVLPTKACLILETLRQIYYLYICYYFNWHRNSLICQSVIHDSAYLSSLMWFS